MQWANTIWHSVRSEPAFWTIIGIVISSVLSFSAAAYLAMVNDRRQRRRDQQATTQAIAREQDARQHAQDERREEFEQRCLVDLLRTAAALDLALSDLHDFWIDKEHRHDQQPTTFSRLHGSFRRSVEAFAVATSLVPGDTTRARANAVVVIAMDYDQGISRTMQGNPSNAEELSRQWDAYRELREVMRTACRHDLFGTRA